MRFTTRVCLQNKDFQLQFGSWCDFCAASASGTGEVFPMKSPCFGFAHSLDSRLIIHRAGTRRNTLLVQRCQWSGEFWRISWNARYLPVYARRDWVHHRNLSARDNFLRRESRISTSRRREVKQVSAIFGQHHCQNNGNGLPCGRQLCEWDVEFRPSIWLENDRHDDGWPSDSISEAAAQNGLGHPTNFDEMYTIVQTIYKRFFWHWPLRGWYRSECSRSLRDLWPWNQYR